MADLLDRVSIDPAVCGGKPCIRGKRIWVSLVLDMLAAGISEAELLSEYPLLTHEDALAAIAYGKLDRLAEEAVADFREAVRASDESALDNVLR